MAQNTIEAIWTNSTHTSIKAGTHTLKFWSLAPGFVLEKIVADVAGLKPSYLGPPESMRV